MSSLFTAAGKSTPAFQCQANHTLLTQGILVDTIALLGGRDFIDDSVACIDPKRMGINQVFGSLLEAFLMLVWRQPYTTGQIMSVVLSRLSFCDHKHLKAQKAPKEYRKD